MTPVRGTIGSFLTTRSQVRTPFSLTCSVLPLSPLPTHPPPSITNPFPVSLSPLPTHSLSPSLPLSSNSSLLLTDIEKKRLAVEEEPREAQRKKVEFLLSELIKKFPPKAFIGKVCVSVHAHTHATAFDVSWKGDQLILYQRLFFQEGGQPAIGKWLYTIVLNYITFTESYITVHVLRKEFSWMKGSQYVDYIMHWKGAVSEKFTETVNIMCFENLLDVSSLWLCT